MPYCIIDENNIVQGYMISGNPSAEHTFVDSEVPSHDSDREDLKLVDGKIVAVVDEVRKKNYEDNLYKMQRSEEYSRLNQFEMQYDDKEDGTTTWEDAIEAIKTKWPKDGSGPVE